MSHQNLLNGNYGEEDGRHSEKDKEPKIISERERVLQNSNASLFYVVACSRILFPILRSDKAGLFVWGKD